MPERFGVYLGTVRDNRDPEQRGRLRVLVPEIHTSQPLPTWAPMLGQSFGASGSRGPSRGSFVVPEIGATVAVVFLSGNVEMPAWMPGPLLAAAVDPAVKSSTRATRDGYPTKSLLVRGRNVSVLEKERGELEITSGKMLITVDHDGGAVEIKVGGGRVRILEAEGLNPPRIILHNGTHRAAREGHTVRVTIPTGTTLTGSVGGSPATFTTSAPVPCDGTITEGADDILLP